jgi:hypothetical protein
VLYDGKRVLAKGILPNGNLRGALAGRGEHMSGMIGVWAGPHPQELVIEYPQPRGQLMTTQLVDTIFAVGRFVEAWGGSYDLIDRKDVKMAVCGDPRAKDKNIRQALIDRVGDTTGVVRDMWAALGVAVTYYERWGVMG